VWPPHINYLYIVLGGLLTLFGLNVWQAMAAVWSKPVLGRDRSDGH